MELEIFGKNVRFHLTNVVPDDIATKIIREEERFINKESAQRYLRLYNPLTSALAEFGMHKNSVRYLAARKILGRRISVSYDIPETEEECIED